MSFPNFVSVQTSPYTVPLGYRARVVGCVQSSSYISINGSVALRHVNNGNGCNATATHEWNLKAGSILSFSGTACATVELYLL